jgi:predicted aspartyl protease
METVLANAFIEEVPNEETSITVPDVYETYLNNLAPGEKAVPLNVAEESFALQSIISTIDNKEEIKGIVDPGSQIIAMSKGMCHDIGLLYDLSIKLNMQSANGDVN